MRVPDAELEILVGLVAAELGRSPVSRHLVSVARSLLVVAERRGYPKLVATLEIALDPRPSQGPPQDDRENGECERRDDAGATATGRTGPNDDPLLSRHRLNPKGS